MGYWLLQLAWNPDIGLLLDYCVVFLVNNLFTWDDLSGSFCYLVFVDVGISLFSICAIGKCAFALLVDCGFKRVGFQQEEDESNGAVLFWLSKPLASCGRVRGSRLPRNTL